MMGMKCRRSVPVPCLAVMVVAVTATAQAGNHAATVPPDSVMAPEPDYDAVLAAEFQAAIAKGTREALIRLVARHPGKIAQRALELLREGSGLPLAKPGSADPDAEVYAAFDVALHADTPPAYNSFIERYAPHPLAEQAARLRDGR